MGNAALAERASDAAAPRSPGLLRRHGSLGADGLVADAATGAGQALPAAVAEELSSAVGIDASAVRVHTDAAADAAAKSIGANAYTQGTHVFFQQGAYQPDSDAGRSLLMEELTHVRQGAEGRLPSSNSLEVSSPGDTAEREAAAVAKGDLAPATEVQSLSPRSAAAASGDTIMRNATATPTVADESGVQVQNVSHMELNVHGPIGVWPGVLEGQFKVMGELELGLNAASETTTTASDGSETTESHDGAVKMKLILRGGLVFNIAFLKINVGLEVGAEALVRGTRDPATALQMSYEELIRWVLATRYPDAPAQIRETLAFINSQIAVVGDSYSAIMESIGGGTRSFRKATNDQSLFDKLGLDSHADDADDAADEILDAVSGLYDTFGADGSADDIVSQFPSVDMVKEEMQALHELRCDNAAQQEAARAAVSSSRSRVMAAFGAGMAQAQAGTQDFGIQNSPLVDLKGHAGVYVGAAVSMTDAVSGSVEAKHVWTFQDGTSEDGSFDTEVGEETHLTAGISVDIAMGSTAAVTGTGMAIYIMRRKADGTEEKELKFDVTAGIKARVSGTSVQDAAQSGAFDKPAETLKQFLNGLRGDGTLSGIRRGFTDLSTNLDLQSLDAALADGATPEAANFYEQRLSFGGELKWPGNGTDHVYFSIGKELSREASTGLAGAEFKAGSALKLSFPV